MADRVKGISVQIGGDTTGLSKALSGVNKEIGSTQRELKDVERLLKLDPTNTELLRQKQELLSKAVSGTKDKLDTLKEAEKQVQDQFARGEISQQQYDALQREIVETEASLDSLEEKARKSNSVLAEISGKADKVASAFDTAAQKTRGLSLAAGGVITGMMGSAVAAGKSADDINTLAKVTGLSTDQIQKFSYATDIIDVSLDTLTGSMAKLTKNMQSAKKGSKNMVEAFDSLGVSITDSTGELRSNDDVFADVIESLGKIENETERDAVAMQIFGKSAQDLNPLILGGADALEELGKEAEDAGLILSQDALDSANEFNDSIDKLKATAQGSFAEIGTEIATMLIPFIESLAEKIGGVLEWVRGLDAGQIEFIGTILLVIAALSPLMKAISGISGAISFITSTVIPGISGAISFLLANPIVLLIAGIVALVTLIATKGEEILAILQNVDDFLQGIFAKDWTEVFGPLLGGILNTFFATVKGIWDSIKNIFSGVVDFIRGVFTGDWERALTGLQNIFKGIFEGLIAIAKAPLNGIIGLLNGIIGAINWVIGGINKISFDVPDWVPGIGGKRLGFSLPNVPSIPYLAKGGILSSGSAVVGEAGPELLTMIGNRAMVEPLTNSMTNNNAYLGGLTVNVYGAPGQDVRELAQLVSQEIEASTDRARAVYR